MATDTFFLLKVKGKMLMEVLFMLALTYKNKMPGKTPYGTLMGV